MDAHLAIGRCTVEYKFSVCFHTGIYGAFENKIEDRIKSGVFVAGGGILVALSITQPHM